MAKSINLNISLSNSSAQERLSSVPLLIIWEDFAISPADGGTRTTAITGTYVALELAIKKLRDGGFLKDTANSPICTPFAEISAGIVKGQPVLDLDYIEDKDAETDMNVVMTARGQFIEVQASGEESTFSFQEFSALQKAAIR